MSFDAQLAGFPVIRTERLTLREPREDDADSLFHHWANDDVARFVALDAPPPKNVDEAKDRIRLHRRLFQEHRVLIPWVITLADQDAFIGGIRYIGFMGHGQKIAEIGYDLDPGHWGRGIMTEALQAVVWFGFQILGLNRIQLTTNPENTGSGRVAEKVGFEKEGLLRQGVFDAVKCQWVDETMYSIVKDAFLRENHVEPSVDIVRMERHQPKRELKEATIGPGQHLARSVSIPDSRFEDVNLAHAEFDNVNLSSVSFNNINFTKMNVSWVRMPNATFSNVVESEGVAMRDCALPSIRFANCNLRDAAFDECDLTGATINGRPIAEASCREGNVEHGPAQDGESAGASSPPVN